MDKLVKIETKYDEILNNYKNKYNFDITITRNFDQFNNSFKKILEKQVNDINVTIDKRDEYDLMKGILSQISGNFNKLTAHNLEKKYIQLFNHRDRFAKILKLYKIKFPKKKVQDDVIIDKPDYGYHKKI